jgi:hypothetical protein
MGTRKKLNANALGAFAAAAKARLDLSQQN